MLYIIDANNLAGKLKMLGEKNFDKKLRDLVKEYYKEKKSRVILVFDSSDPMGDKIIDGNTTLIYTPKDRYYNGADDKIIELTEKELSVECSEFNFSGDAITVVTDDGELIKRIEKIIEDTGLKNIVLKRATDFAVKLKIKKNEKVENGRRGLKKGQINKINDELLGIWK